MFLWRRIVLVCAALLASAHAANAQGAFGLRDGDRVVFYGDSITDQRFYTNFVETYAVTRFPQLRVSFVHSGWGGDRVGGGGGGGIEERLRRDVIAYRPTVMTIMLGMNDGGYKAFDQGTFDTYTGGMQHIIDTAKNAAPGVRITLIQPSPYDDVTRNPNFEGGYNAVLVRYGQWLKDQAQQQNLGIADLNTSVVAALQKAKATDANLSQKILPDRVHPGPGGHLVMAEALLKAWNAPATVSAVEIDAAGKRVARADNARVTDLAAGGNLTWTETDAALPMPVDMRDPAVALAINSSDFVQALDQQPLKVTGLPAARYTLRIDGADVGTFSKEDLANGINLATLNTPMMQQAAKVEALTFHHNDVHAARWRQVQVPLQFLQGDKFPAVQQAAAQAVPALLGALDAEEADTVTQQHAAAQPLPRHFELIAR